MRNTVLHGMLRLVFPSTCMGCGRLTPDFTLPLCAFCSEELELCDPEALHAHLEPVLGHEGVNVVSARWLFDKGGLFQALHQALKYGNRPDFGRALGVMAVESYRRDCAASPDCLIPVPVLWSRRLERGYNQAEPIARGAAEALSCPVDATLLARRGTTRSQTHLSKQERAANVAASFYCPATLSGMHVCIVDDVLTTGATIAACARALRSAGARRVDALGLAWTR
jgi:ComF family protein